MKLLKKISLIVLGLALWFTLVEYVLIPAWYKNNYGTRSVIITVHGDGEVTGEGIEIKRMSTGYFTDLTNSNEGVRNMWEQMIREVDTLAEKSNH